MLSLVVELFLKQQLQGHFSYFLVIPLVIPLFILFSLYFTKYEYVSSNLLHPVVSQRKNPVFSIFLFPKNIEVYKPDTLLTSYVIDMRYGLF